MICRESADHLQICCIFASRSVADWKQICRFPTGLSQPSHFHDSGRRLYSIHLELPRLSSFLSCTRNFTGWKRFFHDQWSFYILWCSWHRWDHQLPVLLHRNKRFLSEALMSGPVSALIDQSAWDLHKIVVSLYPVNSKFKQTAVSLVNVNVVFTCGGPQNYVFESELHQVCWPRFP